MQSTEPQVASRAQHTGRILLGLFLAYAGCSHLFWARHEFLAQVPSWLPLQADLVVVLSGFVEIALGLGLLFLVRRRIFLGFAAALFFVLIFPGNIAQYVEHRNGFNLNTDAARLTRLFFQPLLVWWALGSTGALARLRSMRR